MQIINLPGWLMIVSYIVLWPVFQAGIAWIGSRVPDRFFDPKSFWLKTRRWEKDGDFYKHVFRVDRWKHLLPDGAKAHKAGFRKKQLSSYETEYIKSFISETGRAEIFHWLQIVPFWVFGLWSPPVVIWIMLGYALLVNLPCIIAQRYNRPRLVKIYDYLLRKKAGKSK